MKKLYVLILLIGFSGSLTLKSQELPPAQEVLSSMQLANNYFMAKWPDPGANIVTDKSRPSNLWTRATYYEGLMAYYSISKDTTLYKYAFDWAESHDWEPTYGSLTTRDGDHQCCGQTYIELYLLDPQQSKIQPIKTNIDNMIATSKIDDWSWIDAIQMSMPVFAKLGAVYNDQRYYNRMYQMFQYSRLKHGTNGLYNAQDGLWFRDGDFDPPYTTPNGKSCYWSRGNGWVYAALVRVMDVIPVTEMHYNDYLEVYQQMSDAIIACQREDGFWNPSMADPNDYGGKESSGTGFFVYGLAWGINQGILDKDTYLPAVMKGWNGLQNDALHTNGFLGWMQSTGKQPSDGQPLSYDKVPNFEDYGLGAFLLAGSETYKLASLETSINDRRIATTPVSVSSQGKSNFQVHIHFTRPAHVSLNLYSIQGQKLKQLTVNRAMEQGEHTLTFSKQNLPSGIYMLQMVINNEVMSVKVKW